MAEPKPALDALMHVARRPPVIFVEGKGSWLFDREGRRYLDFVQGWAVNCLGHCHPAIVSAVTRQANALINCSPAFYNAPSARLAGLIARHSCFQKVFFANSGAEANEGAIKLARKWGQVRRRGAWEIVTMEGSFHGRTLATMSASGNPRWKDLYEPKVPGFPKVPLNDLDAVAAAVTEKTAAVMVEPIQGEAGVIPAEDGYLRGLRRLTAERGVLLIVDEIQTGMGRTGTLFAYQHYGIEPDVMTLGKGMGGGVPLAALVAKEEVSVFEPGEQGGTFNGNLLVTAAGCAVMEEITRPGFLDGVVASGDYLRSRIDALSAAKGLGGVRGRGLLLALSLGRDAASEVVDRALGEGLLLNSPRPDIIRFMPALTVSREEIDGMLAILTRCI
ncbi:MAG TPA: acetylornithine transaminase [Candidatus Deferrimicrobiaceae bacterium]